jgi:L-asparaginase II
MKSLQVDVVATRGADIESRHSVHAAVVGADDRLTAAAHDPTLVTSWRSCAKPFQVMPLLEAGGFDELRWGDDQLALACASHGGEPEHVALAQGMLSDIGLEEGDHVVVRSLDLVLAGAGGQAEAAQEVVLIHRGAAHQTGLAVSVPGPVPPNSASIASRIEDNDAPDAASCLVRRVMSTQMPQ